jgi:hypothetical protein
MKYFYIVGFPLLCLMAMFAAGCASKVAGGLSTVQTAALVTCGSEVAAVNVLADLRRAGKLSASQIAAVDADIRIVDPICSNSSPDTLLSAAEAAAASELITLAGGVK